MRIEGMMRQNMAEEGPFPERSPLRGPVALCRLFLRERVGAGDRVIDATCGNGHDTLYMARLVGEQGRVWSFDIDRNALDAAWEKLRQASLDSVVELVYAGHERLSEHVRESVRAIVFNLGYLPGSERITVTRPETTIAALEQALGILLPRGVILLAVYTGHPGGAEEGREVDAWASALPSPEFNVWRCSLVNRRADAPYLLMIEKSAEQLNRFNTSPPEMTSDESEVESNYSTERYP
jgi:SAM-dependent methyltransferase